MPITTRPRAPAMNQPSDHRPSIKPRRAQPLQPDAPGRGREAGITPQEDTATGGAGEASAESTAAQQQLSRTTAEKQKEQSQTALDNVRDGHA